MKYKILILISIFFVSLLVETEATASSFKDTFDNDHTEFIEELDLIQLNSTSIKYSMVREVPFDGYLPRQIWITRDGYSGYIYREYFEFTRYNTWKGVYRGILYRNVAPTKGVE